MHDDPDRNSDNAVTALTGSTANSNLPSTDHLRELFAATVKSIRRYLPVNRAVLVAVGDHYRDLMAIAGWSDSSAETTKVLSLRLPVEQSLFAHVAAQRFEFSDDFYGLFSGTSLESRLLLDGIEGGSYTIRPIRLDSRVVGLIALASTLPGAFGDFDSLDPDHTFAPLALELAELKRRSQAI